MSKQKPQSNDYMVLGRRAFLGACGPPLLGMRELYLEARDNDLAPCRFLTQWGKRGKADGEFDIPIGITISHRDEVFVTDFRNNRVQKFDANGKLLAVIPVMEQPGGIAIDRKNHLYISHLDQPSRTTVHCGWETAAAPRRSGR